MNGRKWNNAVGMLRVAKIYACHSYEFILFEMGIEDDFETRWTSALALSGSST
jgi:hypothetical protein